jgi:hypothetical protein
LPGRAATISSAASPLGHAGGQGQTGVGHQSVEVLHQDLAEIGQLGWLPGPLRYNRASNRWSKRAHDVQMSELAAAALPCRKFGANAAGCALM